MDGQNRGFRSQPSTTLVGSAASRELLQERPRPPQLHEFRSSTEVRLWLPQIQREIALCLQRAQDPSQSTYETAHFQRQAEQLRDYYHACRGRLRELDGQDSDSSQSSSSTVSAPVTVSHHVDVTTTRLGDGGLEETSQECVLPPIVDSVSVSEPSCSSDSSLEHLPYSESASSYSQLEVTVLAVSGTLGPQLGSSHSASLGQEGEE
ncbi:uncharacterized protein LOC144111110 isoform X2 [Amblyomma americanum]